METHEGGADAELVAAVVAGEVSAFGELYDRYCQRIYEHCLRLSGSWSAAEDLTAVVFLEAWRRHGDFRIVRGSAAPWLHGIANNAARNLWRTRRRYQAALGRLAASRPAEPEVGQDPADLVIERLAAEQEVRRVIAALRGLPRQERQAIELCLGADLAQSEVASLLNVPVGTIKSRLSRGLAKLRGFHPGQEVNEGAT